MEKDINIGSFFILGFNGTSIDGTLGVLLQKLQPGGIILFKRNIESPEQLTRLVGDIRQLLADNPPLISIDFEGGRVNRLKSFLPSMPAVRRIALSGDETLPFHFGYISGRILSLFGIDINYAPVVDLYSEDPSNGIGDRAFDSNPVKVRTWAGEYLSGLYQGGVLGCLKHFPGLFGSKVDSHLDLPVDNRSRGEFLADDLVPYKYKYEIPHLVMVAHCQYPSLFSDPSPASLNPEAYRLLRSECGFTGVVVTDDLLMGALESEGDLFDRSKKCLLAGADSVLICDRLEEAAEAVEKFAAFRKEDENAHQRLKAAVTAVEDLRLRLPLVERRRFTQDELEDLLLEIEDIYEQVTEG